MIFNGVITQRIIKCSQIKCSQISYRKTESQVHWQHYLPYFLQKKIGERGGLRPGRPKGVYQACGATQQECHGEHRQSWGHRGRGAGAQGPRSASPTYPSTTVTHTHTHTHTHTELHSAMANFTRHKRPAQLGLQSHNTIIQPRKTSPQSNTQPHCAQHQVT